MSGRRVIQCPRCRDERSGPSRRKWYDYLLSVPWILLGYEPRRCEHCYARYWVRRDRSRHARRSLDAT